MPSLYQREHPDHAAYRAFPVDARGRIASPPIVIEAPNDESALAKARLLKEGHAIELWIGSRKVTTIEAVDRLDQPSPE